VEDARANDERERPVQRPFGDDLNSITGRWGLLDDQGSWRPWMDITLTKQPAP
jgi:hypothetical protein